MTVRDILIPKIRAERLFPNVWPKLNTTHFVVHYLSEIARRLDKQKPRFPFRSRLIPPIEDTLFYQDILTEEGERTEEVVAGKLFEVFLHDRVVLVRAMRILGLHLKVEPGRIFNQLHRKYSENALQELSKEKGDGSYVITVKEIPALDYEEGINFLVEKIVSKYRMDNGISQKGTEISEALEESAPVNSSPGQDLQELRRQVESLDEEISEAPKELASVNSSSGEDLEELRSQVDSLEEVAEVV